MYSKTVNTHRLDPRIDTAHCNFKYHFANTPKCHKLDQTLVESMRPVFGMHSRYAAFACNLQYVAVQFTYCCVFTLYIICRSLPKEQNDIGLHDGNHISRLNQTS